MHTKITGGKKTYNRHLQFSSVQSLSRIWLFVTPWTAALQASLSITNSWSLPKPMSTELVMPSNHLILCHPLLLLTSIFPSIRVFSNESALCIKWPKNWNFSFYFWLNYKSSLDQSILDLKSRLGKFKMIDIISNFFFLTTMLWFTYQSLVVGTVKNMNTCRLTNTPLLGQEIADEIREKITEKKKSLEANNIKNMIIQNLWSMLKQ